MDQVIADRYTVTGMIGAGGGGTVWRAEDGVLERTVAVKEVQLPPHLSDADRDRVRTRALREARAAARLDHRAVIAIFDVVEGDDALWIVMEHVDAPSLSTVLDRDGPLAPARAASIGLDVLAGLAAAHGAGVVHRDIKPSNVLVTDGDTAVVTDFGVAAVLDETGLTRSGEALGTPDYIAPEQLEEGPVGPPADLWALGATLYHAVEGVPPFQRDRTMATIHGVASAEPRTPERAGPLHDVLLRLLDKDPDARPDVEATTSLLIEARDAASHDDTTDTPTQPMAAAATVPIEGEARTERIDTPTTPVTPPPVTPPPDPVPPDPSPVAPPPAAGPDPSRRRAGLALGGLLAASAVIAALVMGLGDDRGPADDEVAQSPTASSAPTSPDVEPTTDEDAGAPAAEAEPEAGQDTTQPDDPTDEARPLPDGWTLYDGGAYAVGVPADWEPRDAPGQATDLVSPAGDVYLRTGDTDDPADDVLADTQRIRDSFASRYDTYDEISLEPVEYRGYEAVLWEYTYAPEGRELRSVHLNFSNGDHAYVLNYQGPAEQWDDLAGRFDDITASFREQ